MSKLYKMKGDNEIKNDDENKNIYIYREREYALMEQQLHIVQYRTMVFVVNMQTQQVVSGYLLFGLYIFVVSLWWQFHCVHFLDLKH